MVLMLVRGEEGGNAINKLNKLLGPIIPVEKPPEEENEMGPDDVMEGPDENKETEEKPPEEEENHEEEHEEEDASEGEFEEVTENSQEGEEKEEGEENGEEEEGGLPK